MISDALRQSLPYRALRQLKRALAGEASPGAPPASASGFQWSADARRVWVETPEPPHNLVNVLYNDAYCTLIDHCARGNGRHMTPEGLRNNVIENERILYVRDDETGEFFAVPWLPVARPAALYRATIEPGSLLIENTTGDLAVAWRIFVPAGADPVEVWNVSVRDLARRPRRVSLFTYASMKCDGVDLYSGDMFRIARYSPEVEAIVVRTDAEQHAAMDFPWHNGFLTADRAPAGWDASPGPFIGGGGRTLRDPRAVVEGACGGSASPMWPPIAALHHRLQLAPGATARVRYLAGACDGEPMIAALRRKFCVPWAEADAHLAAVRDRIDALASATKIDVPEPTVGGMLNVWVKLQSHYGLAWGRWGFCGYRDQLQQAIGSLGQDDALARRRILEACRHQFADGFALRGWRPLDRHRLVDSASWLIPAVTEYLKETGDFALLDEEAPFFDGGAASVFEHLVRAMERLYADRGAHGLPLMFEGDWNDSLSGPCRAGRGESVWMAMAYCRAAAQLAELAGRTGRAELAATLQARRRAMAEAVNAHAWDGAWYLRALDDDGAPIGSSRNDEGQIYLNTQSWAQLGGVADGERWERAWAAVRERLDTGWGYMLNAPTYTRPVANVGRLSYIRPGAGENGSVYTHGNAFLFLALLERGLANEALAVWQAIHPGNPRRPGAAMPNVFYNGFYGPASEIMPGLADHAWTTGSCAWMLFGAVDLMIGARRTYDGLVMRPCLPSGWPAARLTRRYHGTLYRIQIVNPHGISGATVEAITVDGEPHPIEAPLPIDGGEHQVHVTLGNHPAGVLYDWRP